MAVNLRNTSGTSLIVNGVLRVEDEVFTVSGDVSDDSPDDGYLIDGALWPKANFTNAGGRAKDEEKD